MRNRQLHNSHYGMTLVELLVVAAIIGALLAISVPFIRPMLDSRKTHNAAQVLAGAFQKARMKSMQEGKGYGVRLIPFENAPTTAIQLHFQKVGVFPNLVNPLNVRVKVVAGEILPYYFDDSDGEWRAADSWNDVSVAAGRDQFLQGSAVQFDHLGRFLEYTINGSDQFQLNPPYDNLDLPDPTTNINDAMEYQITGQASIVSAWVPPAVMPRGTIVDLVFSGGETVNFGGGDKSPDDIPPAFSSGNEVVVLFSPAGHVDFLFIDGIQIKVNEMLYFCVGEWDRQMDAAGNPMAEDKKTNIDVPSTYWVTIHPKTGGIRITENAPIQSGNGTIIDPIERKLQDIRDARKFAKEHFFNVGN